MRCRAFQEKPWLPLLPLSLRGARHPRDTEAHAERGGTTVALATVPTRAGAGGCTVNSKP